MNADQDTIARLLDDHADETERENLIRLLRDDPDAAKTLGAHLLTDALLGIALEDEVSQARGRQRIIGAVRRAERDRFVSGVRSRISRRIWSRRLLAGAAVLALGVITWFAFPRRSGNIVATVTRAEVAEAHGFATGDPLASGRRLRFGSGLVELDMAGRGKMIVEGPADLEISGPMRSVLHRGRILMRVNRAGHGYRLETPKGSVIDLGTEFGVSVDENQSVETHVLAGEVEAIPASGEKILLRENDALRSDSSGDHRFAADGGSFYTDLPPPRATGFRAVHWPLDFPNGDGAPPSENALNLRSMDRGLPPQGVAGKFGGALAFDGKGAYAESAFAGVGGREPRTVSFWVRVPPDFNQREGFALISWGRFSGDDFGAVWQISINPVEADGPVGRLRVGNHGGRIIGQTDLRDGQWHHVAVVLYQSSRPDVGKQVIIYLDGDIEPITRRALREVNTRIGDAKHGVWLGRNVAYTQSDPSHRHGGFFRGCLDEVYILNCALSHGEVRLLMERNESPR